MLKKNMRGLIMNYALDHMHRNGEVVKVKRGTAVKEVSERRFLAERAIY